MNKLTVNMNFLENLVLNTLNDHEVVLAYMQHYVAQGRNFCDLQDDLVYRYKTYHMGLKELEAFQIRNVLLRVKKVVKTHLIAQYGIEEKRISLGSNLEENCDENDR